MAIPTTCPPRGTSGRRRAALSSAIVVSLLLALAPLLGSAASAAGSGVLRWSSSSTRAPAADLEGAQISGSVYVFFELTGSATRVRFFVDDPGMLLAPRTTEKNPPYDLLGSTSDGITPKPLDTRTLGDGPHTVTAAATMADGTTTVVSAAFAVRTGTTPTPGPSGSSSPSASPSASPSPVTGGDVPPDQVHLSWTEDATTTLTVVWRTRRAVTAPVQYRRVGDATTLTAAHQVKASGTYGVLHQATMRGLTPGTAYEYRVPGDGAALSAWTRAATASGPGSALDVLFFADTGIAGRTDGLATATLAVRDAMIAQQADLALGGGDYAYYNTETRFASVDDAINAWFQQTQPLAARVPLMPTYGNHEAYLGEGFNYWGPRFATPAGPNSSRNYSFDVGDVHFVSVFAVEETAGIPSTAFSWLDQDLAAARARGMKWSVPYMHVPAFSDGTNHSSNLALRAQLGPLFEKHRIPLVLTTHDQSYERTYPLRDVPATNSPTTSALACFGPGEGTTWIKVSPAGKLSNISKGFSPFASSPPPAYTAVRSNSEHHWARLLFDPAGRLEVETWGLMPGQQPWVVDRWEHRLDETCPAELAFRPSSLPVAVEQGTSTQVVTQLDVIGTTGTTVGLSSDAPWLTAPAFISAPSRVPLSIDAKALAPGRYRGVITATAGGARSASVTVELDVVGPDRLLWSMSSDRSSPRPLNGSTLTGRTYVFAEPRGPAAQVRFFLDDPSRVRSPRHVERNAPYDFSGGTVSSAYAFDTRTIASGRHTITAEVTLSDGIIDVVHGVFDVVNP